MYLIISGRIRVSILGESGREVTLSSLRAGQSFGEMSLLDGNLRSANCIASEASTLAMLRKTDLLQHMTRFPATAMNLLQDLARRLRHADENIAQLALCDVNERLIHRLIHISEEEGFRAAEGMLIKRRPTQQELANMVGSCRETISRAFNQLARDGLIVSKGRTLLITNALLSKSSKSMLAAA